MGRGTYKVTVWAMDSNQVANDFAMRFQTGDGSPWVTKSTNTVTLTSEYRPYTLFANVEAGDHVGASYGHRIHAYKVTGSANDISIGCMTVEYLGMNVLGSHDLTAYATQESDADESRKSSVSWWGNLADGNQGALVKAVAQHVGSGSDHAGELDFQINSGGEAYDTLASIFKLSNTIDTFVDGDATPDVAGGNIFTTGNTGATTITNIDTDTSGKVIKIIIGDANTIFDFTGTTLKGNKGADWAAADDEVVYAICDGTNWYFDVGSAGGADPQPVLEYQFIAEADGADNNIATIKKHDSTAHRSYCRGTGVDDTQDMDWYATVILAQAITATKDITVWVRMSDYANGVMTLSVQDQDGNADATGAVVVTPAANDTWAAKTYSLTSTYTEDEIIEIKMRVTSLDTADTADFGQCSIDL